MSSFSTRNLADIILELSPQSFVSLSVLKKNTIFLNGQIPYFL